MNDEFNKLKDAFTEELQELQIRFFKVLDELRQAESKQVEQPQSKWKPEINERYYYANPVGKCFFNWRDWRGDEFDIHLYNAGLIHKTENEAVELGKQMYYTQWFNNLSDVTDEMQKDSNVDKYCIFYDFVIKKISPFHSTTSQFAHVAYFTSVNKLNSAIETIGRENFDRYVMRVKE